MASETIKHSGGIISTDLDLCAEILDQVSKQKVESKSDFKVVYVETVFDMAQNIVRNVEEADVAIIEGPMPKQVLDKVF